MSRSPFAFEPLALFDLATAIALGLLSVVWFEAIKPWRREPEKAFAAPR